MQSIRRRLSIILIVCSFSAVVLSALFVNVSVANTFNKYMKDTQNKRNERIVQYLEEIYRRDGGWSKNSGQEMRHEAFMSNYCLTLLDSKKNVVWGMNPDDIKDKTQMMMHGSQEKGVYTSKTLGVKVDGNIVGYAVIGQYSPILLSEEDINFKKSINESIVASVVLTIIFVALISMSISKQFSNPIKKVSEISMDLSKGNYESRSNIKSTIKEISNLNISINTLGDTLKNQDLLRKRLVTDISHEIRTPLNVLQNNLEAMIDGILPITEERLNGLNEEVIRFGKLLNNLNSLKEFESEELNLNMDNVSIEELVASVYKDFSIPAAEKNIEMTYNVQVAGEYVTFGDQDKLKQVFINLLSNAIKFTRSGGKVEIDLKEVNDKIVIQIKDNGIGIKREDINFIFERLYRGDKSRQEIEGSGIGLTIVKKILSLHSAAIEVESEIDKGTIFTLYFNKET